MKEKEKFSRELIKLQHPEEKINHLVKKIEDDVKRGLRRRGGVVGISGGIDSSVCLALAVKALGAENVVAVMMPDKDSNPESEKLARELAARFNVKNLILEDMSAALEGFGCYRRRDEAVKSVFPEYDPAQHKMKIGIKQRGLFSNIPPVFSLTVIDANGTEHEQTLPANAYLQIVAASNFKRRSRMSMLYYHAESRHYAVIGTPNKHETDQGFFVKYGDGGADIMPIGTLYKTQVYQIAEQLGVPRGIINRTPTTDTYTAEQTQEEFFFQLPFELLDLYWYGYENGYSPAEVAEEMGETEERIEALFKNFERKKMTTAYLRMAPVRDY